MEIRVSQYEVNSDLFALRLFSKECSDRTVYYVPKEELYDFKYGKRHDLDIVFRFRKYDNGSIVLEKLEENDCGKIAQFLRSDI